MVALLCLFEFVEILFEVGFFVKRRTVNSGEHFVLLVTAPVSTGERREFETFDFARGRKVRTRAKVGEIALRIESDFFSFGYIGKQFHFVGLLHLPDKLFGFLTGNGLLDNGHIGFDYALHFRFDFLEIRLSDRGLEIEIVIETVFNGGSYGELNGRINVLDRLSENMRTSVTVSGSALFVGESEHFESAILVDDRVHRSDLSVNATYESRSCKTFADLLCDFERGFCAVNLHFVAVFECDKHKKLLCNRPHERPCLF